MREAGERQVSGLRGVDAEFEAEVEAEVDAENQSGSALVDGIDEDNRVIGWLEAQKLIKIARLYAVGEMQPRPPSEAAQRSAACSRRTLAALTREDLTTKEVGSRLYLSDYAARRMVRLALALTTRFPGTLQALSEGRLDLRRVEIIVEHAGPLAEDHYQIARSKGLSPAEAERSARAVAGMVESMVLGKATTQAPHQLHPSVRTAVNRLDPGFCDRQAKRELKARQVTHRTNPTDGTGDLYAHLGAAEAQGVYNVVDSYARAAREVGSHRTLNELRADALTHLILVGHLPDDATSATPVDIDTEDAVIVPDVDPNTGDIYRHPETGTHLQTETGNTETGNAAGEVADRDATDALTTAGDGVGGTSSSTGGQRRAAGSGRSALRAHVQVTVGLDTLMGLNDEPGVLAGHGPITAQTARDLAFSAGSTWRRLVTDPVTGYLLNYGRKTYRPPVALADHVRARDVTCRAPNCSRPATRCHLDHVISWPAGETSEQNLATECDHDHRLKHEGNWRHQVSIDPEHPPGTIVMISPTGQVYLSYPHSYTDPRPGHQAGPQEVGFDDDPGPPPF